MLEITFELSADELKPFLDQAASDISKSKNIKGFRPGHAPLEIVIKEVGEMTIYQTAANYAVEKIFNNYIDEQNIEAIDQPKVEVLKLAPGNPFSFKATIALVPKITICDLDKIKVDKLPEIKIEDKEVEKVLNDLQKMKAKEVLEEKTAEKGDKVEISFETFVDNVPIAGGKAEKHGVVIGEGHMIPGFEDNLIGLKKDDAKEFELEFPKKYHEEKLQGKKALFKIKVLAVYKIELPKIDDELAKGLGLKDLDGLKGNLSNNIKQEKEMKARQKQELEIIEKLIEKSEFAELPDSLIDTETHKMLHELQENITRQGMKMEDYLNHIKKTEADLRLDFTPDAIKRVKTALAIRQIAKDKNIQATDDEIKDEKEKTLISYQMNPAYAAHVEDLKKQFETEQASRYLSNVIINRKTMEYLKNKVLGEEQVKS